MKLIFTKKSESIETLKNTLEEVNGLLKESDDIKIVANTEKCRVEVYERMSIGDGIEEIL